MHTSEEIQYCQYEDILGIRDEVIFGGFWKDNNLIENDRVNLWKLLPSNICREVIKYADGYDGEVMEIYHKLKEKFYEKYCYYLQRFDISQLSSSYDYDYFFYVHLKAILRLIEEKKIKIIYSGPPSCGIDNLISEVAAIKKIKLVCLYQSHNGRFFWTTNWSDMGYFKTAKPIFPEAIIRLPKIIIDPFYMVRNKKSVQREKKLVKFANKFFNNLNLFRIYLYAVRVQLNLFLFNDNLGPFGVSKILIQVHNFSNRVCSEIDEKLRINNNKKNKNLISLKNETENTALKVLFYLKVQPEATEAFSSEFITNSHIMVDQLSKALPKNSIIYVKDHPDNIRNFVGLRRFFWESISHNHRVKVLDTQVRTSEIIDEVDIIATFDGTVGWEGLLKNKPVITFGNPWYQCMPGVFPISKLSNIEEVLRAKLDRAALYESLKQLSLLMGEGYVIDIQGGYINATDEFVPESGLSDGEKIDRLRNNDVKVANSFLKIYDSIMS